MMPRWCEFRAVDDGEDIHGEGVNIAARLEGLAEPGGICISAMVNESIRNRIDANYEDMGEKTVKHVSAPVRVYRITSSSDAASTETGDLPPEGSADTRTIAVLPFTNMSGDEEQEYFSDGITEDIITDLSKISGLVVIARNSTFVYKGKAVNIPDICKDLGATVAVEGSVRKSGNRVRVTAQLIDGSGGGHLWAERYDRELDDIFEVQDDVTQRIVEALKLTLSPAEISLIADGGTTDVGAHDFFLKGRGLLLGQKKDRLMFEQSTGYFRSAITLDRNYAEPFAGLAMAYVLDHQNRWSDAPETFLDQADRLIGQSIDLDGKDPYAHYVDALVGVFTKIYKRWAEAAVRALALNSNFALALNTRGLVHLYSGAPGEAIPDIERAMRLDPVMQQQYMHFLGSAYFVAGDYAKAAAIFKDRIQINPETDLTRAFLASALGHLNEPEEARRIWAELMDINPEYSAEAHIGRLPFQDPKDADRFLEGLLKTSLAA
jgi:adenylate cyclase